MSNPNIDGVFHALGTEYSLLTRASTALLLLNGVAAITLVALVGGPTSDSHLLVTDAHGGLVRSVMYFGGGSFFAVWSAIGAWIAFSSEWRAKADDELYRSIGSDLRSLRHDFDEWERGISQYDEIANELPTEDEVRSARERLLRRIDSQKAYHIQRLKGARERYEAVKGEAGKGETRLASNRRMVILITLTSCLLPVIASTGLFIGGMYYGIDALLNLLSNTV